MLPRIQILSSGEFLKLSSKGLTVAIRSGLFQSQGNLIGSTAYPFSCPLEDNKAIIKNAQIINSDISLRSVLVRLWIGSIPWKNARMSFIIKGKEISGTLLIDSGSLASRLKGLMLNYFPFDLNADNIVVGGYDNFIAYMNATVTAPVGTYPVVFFPFKNDGAYKTDLKADDYPEITIPWSPYFNSWAIDPAGNGTFQLNKPAEKAKHTTIPFFYLAYILKRVLLYLGYRATGDWFNREQNNRIVVAGCVPVFVYNAIGDFTYYMPKISVADFLEELKSRLGIDVFFDETHAVAEVYSVEDVLVSGSAVDLREAQIIGYDEDDTAQPAFKITESIDDNDTAFSETDRDAPPALEIGDILNTPNVTEVKLKSVGTKMIGEIGPPETQSIGWRIPWIKKPIAGTNPYDKISEVSWSERSNVGLRLLYYHGMQTSASGYMFPYGSSDNLDIFGQPIGKFTLSLIAPNGSSSPTSNYYNFIKNAKPFEMGFKLSPAEFLQIKTTRRVVVREPFTGATIPCLISDVTADLGPIESVLAKATLYPINVSVNTGELSDSVVIIKPPVDNGIVYVKLQARNPVFDAPPRGTYNRSYGDFYAKFYADQAGTIPKDVANLSLRVQTVLKFNDQEPSISFTNIDCTSANGESLIFQRAPISASYDGGRESYSYYIIPTAYYNVLT